MDIIYCGTGHKKLVAIAIQEGFLYGARSDLIRPGLRCDGLIDINWVRYDWRRYRVLVGTHNPKYAVVPDVFSPRQLPRALRYASQLEEHCHRVVLVPKVHGLVKYIPAKYVVGISVPTTYAGFLPGASELIGRDVHLLGGTPPQQRELWKYFHLMGIRVVSLDTNSHAKASDFGSYWDGSKWCDDDRDSIGKYRAFTLSCQGIMAMWRRLGAIASG